jgi:Transposase DDE domain
VEPANQIKSDPLLFDKLLEPISKSLEQLNEHPISQAAKILKYAVFVRVLLFRIFAQIRSLRDLKEDLHSSETPRKFNLPVLGLSTLHDGFARYPLEWLIGLIQRLQADYPVEEIGELKALGRIWAADSSFWPIVRRLGWLQSGDWKGVRLHLGLSLNQFCTATFLLTYDISGAVTETAAILSMLEKGLTFILDRGYVNFKFYCELIDRGAFFVIRQRNNCHYVVLSEINVQIDPSLNQMMSLTDQIIKLIIRREKQDVILRLVCFNACGHRFRLLTNRFDLTTRQIILLYAWRWQVELIFRAWKHTLNGLHLINLSEKGIAAQFYILLLASLLWAIMQQQAESMSAASSSESKLERKTRGAKTVTAQLSQVFQVPWRLLRKHLKVCANCLAQSFSFYLKERIRILNT